MTSRRDAVRALLRTYPREWRDEYGPEFEALLLSAALTPRVVVNVLCHGAWQRGRAAWHATRRRVTGGRAGAPVSDVVPRRVPRLWRRACLAWLAMELASAAIGGMRLGNTQEFEHSFWAGAMFVAFISVPYMTAGSFVVFLPVVASVRALGTTWSAVRVLVLGAALSLVAFAVVVTGSWCIDGMRWSYAEHIAIVLSQPRSYGFLLPVYMLGAIIVASGLRTPPSAPFSMIGSRRQII
jgi:hypothetical protein